MARLLQPCEFEMRVGPGSSLAAPLAGRGQRQTHVN
jgi:hypothetical protein